MLPVGSIVVFFVDIYTICELILWVYIVFCACLLIEMDKNIYGKLQPQQYHGTYQPYRCTRKNGSKPGCESVYLH